LSFVHYLQTMTMNQGFIVVNFFFNTYRRWRCANTHCHLLFVLFLCTQKRCRQVDARHCFFFPFCASKEYENEQVHRLLFLFCFYAPTEDDNEPTFIIIFFCFVSVHPKKTITTNQHSSSSFFFCFYAPKKDDNESALVIVFLRCWTNRQHVSS
jgi:hypothetical protein